MSKCWGRRARVHVFSIGNAAAYTDTTTTAAILTLTDEGTAMGSAGGSRPPPPAHALPPPANETAPTPPIHPQDRVAAARQSPPRQPNYQHRYEYDHRHLNPGRRHRRTREQLAGGKQELPEAADGGWFWSPQRREGREKAGSENSRRRFSYEKKRIVGERGRLEKYLVSFTKKNQNYHEGRMWFFFLTPNGGYNNLEFLI
ncbi:hypothetical protein Zmor_004923 [Zophobas morio]|uniref:Uncharacterized protein n=1 Tax=Zophobas morio TaxID=2755281 RepID=A0AA38IRB4_9CUCU|nr:hypothetical protein Zmor_004923 [Zophobas morio]